MIKTYSELILLKTFEERINYLKLSGKVGEDTFGFDRYLNQDFYRSRTWKNFRNRILVRDNGCDLGIPDREIFGRAHIHHINPITKIDLIDGNEESLLNPENVITVSDTTHKFIHYGIMETLILDTIERHPNDTCPWK